MHEMRLLHDDTGVLFHLRRSMPSTAIRCIVFSAACFCAAAVAQVPATETPLCGPAERMAFAPVAERGIAELRGFLFAKKQLDQLAQYLESKEGAAKWAEATPASRLKLLQAATRGATISGAAATRLPFLASTRYAFEGQFPFECSKSAQLLAQMREPGFARYLDVRARVAAEAVSWYATGLFSKLPHAPALPIASPFAAPGSDAPAKAAPSKAAPAKTPPSKDATATTAPSKTVAAKAGTAKARPPTRRTGTPRLTPAERQAVLARRNAAVDSLLRDIGVFNVGMTAIENDLLLTGALANIQTPLLDETVETLANPGLKSVLLDPAYIAFNYAVMLTALKSEPMLVQDYPHLEPLGRNMSQAWAADLLRAAPKSSPSDPKSATAPPAESTAPAAAAPNAPAMPAAAKP
jgi:hypothetical protein